MTSSLLFLTSDDFFLTEGQKGPIMCTAIKGFSLILFYSSQCPHCHTLIPIFKKLPDIVAGCQFGMINVSKNKQVVSLSSKTIAPLQYVPYVVLYIHGKPFMRYDGPQDEVQIRRFILEIANQVQEKPNFIEETKSSRKELPGYSIGTPMCGDNEVCYLEYNEAYKEM